MIKINKELQRPDKGKLPSGTIIHYTAQFLEVTKSVKYNLKHWFDELARGEGSWQPIDGVTDFEYRQVKECSDDEWDSLNDAGVAEMIKLWLQEIIEDKIGTGTTEII